MNIDYKSLQSLRISDEICGHLCFLCLNPDNDTKAYMDRFSISTEIHPRVLHPGTLDACPEISNVTKTHHISLTHGGKVHSMDEQGRKGYHRDYLKVNRVNLRYSDFCHVNKC